jgi:putative ABC transport system permease protein
MFGHYLLTAWKVLLRRKFFTFVNLFGIAITLAVLTVVIALLENFVQPHGAERTATNYVAVKDVALRDSAEEHHKREWSSRPGFRFIERHIWTLELPDITGIVHGPNEATLFVDGLKLTPDLARTDAGFWKILDFRFLEGRPLSQQDVDQGRFVAVINAAMRESIFAGASPLGENLTVNGQRFEVVGVVENEAQIRTHAYSDIWVPYTTFLSTNYRDEWLGDFAALLYAEDPARIPAIQEEFLQSLETFEYHDPDEFAVALSSADTKLDRLAREMMGTYYEKDSKAGLFLLLLFGAMLAFMLLPTINLVNLNVSRIMERASEIGVRKAFGASGTALVGQFLVENVVLSIVGGLLGFALGLVLIDMVEGSGLIAYAEISINLNVFLGAFFLMTLFGAISGAYPAWKMSRMNPVDALRGGA